MLSRTISVLSQFLADQQTACKLWSGHEFLSGSRDV